MSFRKPKIWDYIHLPFEDCEILLYAHAESSNYVRLGIKKGNEIIIRKNLQKHTHTRLCGLVVPNAFIEQEDFERLTINLSDDDNRLLSIQKTKLIELNTVFDAYVPHRKFKVQFCIPLALFDDVEITKGLMNPGVSIDYFMQHCAISSDLKYKEWGLRKKIFWLTEKEIHVDGKEEPIKNFILPYLEMDNKDHYLSSIKKNRFD